MKDQKRGRFEGVPSVPPPTPGVPSWSGRPWAGRRVWVVALVVGAALGSRALELKDAVVVTAPGLAPTGKQAVVMLVEEVEKRSGVRWPTMTHWPSAGVPVIAVGLKADAQSFAGSSYQSVQSLPGPDGAEGYRLCLRQGETNPAVYILGNDLRGVLFGVGRLLRELHWGQRRVWAADDLNVATAPAYRLRGHQLGYRPKCNSYDAWDLPVWEQYFRDLAVFGCNAVELLPPHTDDSAYSPHFPRPQMEMMEGMSRVAAAYGLDVWVWFPAMASDYADPKTVEAEIKEWGDVLGRLPRVDAVFVPGGDPGHTPPRLLMNLLEKETANLHRFHPQAGMWVSPQGFDQKWMDEFLDILRLEQPTWLSGVVYGPQVRMTLPRFRELIPAQYPIRHYPDITHTRQCEYAVPNWDVAYAVTEARECINPRPEDEAVIFRKVQPQSIGFISYSEGCNDDVNKIVWSALGWDPDLPVIEILRQYSRYFIGERYTDDFAHGLLGLERDWRGPLMANTEVDVTLEQFQRLEREALPAVLRNWRFQQALFRAYYDAYVRHRLIYETDLEAQAMACLRAGPVTGVAGALGDAQRCLNQATRQRVNPDWRLRIYQLAEALFQSIGMQLSVDKYQAIAIDRGASLDTVDFPLNNRFWLEDRFAKIRNLSSRKERLAAIDEILHWTDPGPGGFYDNLSDAAPQPHLVWGPGFAQDPGCYQSCRVGFEDDLVVDSPDEDAGTPRRLSWVGHAETLYDTPLRMVYTGLDAKAQYQLRVLYGGDSPRRKIRCLANGSTEIHPYITKPRPFKPLEFVLPREATREGKLELSWLAEPGLGGNGRACQVSEVWLIKMREKH